jgi:DNA-binding transcriptional LysR family regulator
MTGLEEMRAFVEVVESGGINRAALRLGLSKSIVSRRITALEQDLGVLLLARSTRGVVPTEAGEDFRQRCEMILADVAAAREAASGKVGEVTGRLRVTAPQVLGHTVVGPVLADLAAAYPGLQIDAVFTDRVVDLVAEGFDLAIRIGTPRGANLIRRKIAPIRAVLVASPAYLERAGIPLAPTDLAAHDCIGYDGAAHWRFRMGRRWVQVRPGGRLRTNSGETIVQWARAGLGIGNVPGYLALADLESGTLLQVLPDAPQPEIGVYTMRPPSTRPPAKVVLLIEALVARIKSGPGFGP